MEILNGIGVKQVAWRWDRGLLVRFLAVGCGLNKSPGGGVGGLLVRFLAVGCGLNKSPGGGMGVCWCASSPLAAG